MRSQPTPYGWSSYPSKVSYATSTETVPGGTGEPATPRPEPADLVRLGRRALRSIVRTARADLAPTLTRRLLDHLGPGATGAAVVQEQWRAYDHVNVQAGLDAWLAEPGREHEVVGIARF